MNCSSIESALAGYVGGDLREGTAALVAEHIGTCDSCRATLSVLERGRDGLAVLVEHEVEPPPGLYEAILDRVHEPRRRAIPFPPVVPPVAARVLSDNRDAIVSAAGAAVVVAGAAWAVWRAAKRPPTAEPAIS